MNKNILIPLGNFVYPGQQVVTVEKQTTFGKGISEQNKLLISTNLGFFEQKGHCFQVRNPKNTF